MRGTHPLTPATGGEADLLLDHLESMHMQGRPPQQPVIPSYTQLLCRPLVPAWPSPPDETPPHWSPTTYPAQVKSSTSTSYGEDIKGKQAAAKSKDRSTSSPRPMLQQQPPVQHQQPTRQKEYIVIEVPTPVWYPIYLPYWPDTPAIATAPADTKLVEAAVANHPRTLEERVLAALVEEYPRAPSNTEVHQQHQQQQQHHRTTT